MLLKTGNSSAASVIMFLLVALVSGIPNPIILNRKTTHPNRLKCGHRKWGVPMNNATQDTSFSVDNFRSVPEAFPWLVKLVTTADRDQLVLCTGAAVSNFVAVFPAHCVSGHRKNRLLVVQTGSRRSQNQVFSVENAIVHPDFNMSDPGHQHDVAVLKVQEDGNSRFGENRIACLPEFDEDPVDECQIASYFPAETDPEKVGRSPRARKIWCTI